MKLSFASAVLAWIFIAGSQTHAQQGRAAATAPSQAPAAAATANGYVGESTCLTCHDQKYTGTAHGLKSDPHTPAATLGCESCHGPGKAHVDSGGEPDKIVNN